MQPRQEHKGNTRQTHCKRNQRDKEAGTDVTVNSGRSGGVFAQQMASCRYLVKLKMHLTIIYLHEQTFLFLFLCMRTNQRRFEVKKVNNTILRRRFKFQQIKRAKVKEKDRVKKEKKDSIVNC